MFDTWPSVIIKKSRIKYNDDHNTDIEICYIQTYKDDNDTMASSSLSNRQWISVSVEDYQMDNIIRSVYNNYNK